MNKSRHMIPPIKDSMEIYPQIAMLLKNMDMSLFSGASPSYLRGTLFRSSLQKNYKEQLSIGPVRA
jgi:hypothetical protein